MNERDIRRVEVSFLFDLIEARAWGKAELEFNHKRMAHVAEELVINSQCRPANRADCELN